MLLKDVVNQMFAGKINATLLMDAAVTSVPVELARMKLDHTHGPVLNNNRSLTSCTVSMQSTVVKKPLVPLKIMHVKTAVPTLSKLRDASALRRSMKTLKTTNAVERRTHKALLIKNRRLLLRTTFHVPSMSHASVLDFGQ